MPSARGFDVLRAVAGAPLRAPRSAAQSRLRDNALALVRGERLLAAAFSYRIVPLDRPAGDVLCLDGRELEAPWLLPASGTLTAVACAVATIGDAIERRVSRLFAERRASLAIALDALGNELLFAVSRRAQDRMLVDATRSGLTMAGELRAGDPGLAIETQGTVLELAEAACVGVTLSSGSMMYPVKSTSMVLGAGLALPKTNWSRCDYCPSLDRCAIARAPA
jgi:hypothetical protein